MARRVEYGLAVGDDHSHGRSFALESDADREGQAVADAQQLEVSVYRFEVDETSNEIREVELLRVLVPQPPSAEM